METDVVREGGRELLSAAKELQSISDEISSSANFIGINQDLCASRIDTIADSCEQSASNAGVFE